MSEQDCTRDLLDRWRNGDDSAAEALYRRYAQRLCALVERHISERLARRVDADDIAQSAFRTFFRRARDGQFAIDHSSSLWHLLVRIALHKVQKQAEFHGAKQRALSAEVHGAAGELSPEAVAHDPTPVEAALLADELETVLSKADAVEAEMFQLCLQGYSSTEIGDRLGVSRWTVRRVLDHFGGQLQQRLRPDAGQKH
jgi:RNA polymerase sigma-70 factor (ECF subfamily)